MDSIRTIIKSATRIQGVWIIVIISIFPFGIVPRRAKSHDPHVAISAFDCCLYRLEMKKAIEWKKSSA
jgi:hypothetical protein